MITIEQTSGNVARIIYDTKTERKALDRLLERKIRDPDSGLMVPITVVWGEGCVPAGLIPYMQDRLSRRHRVTVIPYGDEEEEDLFFPVEPRHFVNRDVRDYQVRAARTLLGASRGIMQGSTGSGKTTVIGAMLHAILEAKPDWRIMVLGFTTDHWKQVKVALQEMNLPTQQIGRGNPKSPIAVGRFSSFEKQLNKAGPWNDFIRSAEVVVYDECLRGNSLVETERGLIPIKDLKGLEGIRVLSYDTRSKALRYERMTAWMPKGKRKTVKLSLSNGQEIFCTPEHKFLTSCGWKPAGELCPNDRLVGSLRRFSAGQQRDPSALVGAVNGYQYQPMRSLSVGEINRSKRTGGNTQTCPGTTLGYFVETCQLVLKYVGGYWERFSATRVWSSINEKQELIHESCAIIQSYRRSGRLTKQQLSVLVRLLEYSLIPVTGRSGHLLERQLFPRLPKYIECAIRRALKSYRESGLIRLVQRVVRGGGVTMDRRDSHRGVYPKRLFIQRGSLRRKTRLFEIGLQTLGTHHPSTELVEDTPLSDYAQPTHTNGWKTTDSGYPTAWRTKPVYVVSIEDAGVEDVYDIEVENTHNFVANGVVVHNCRHLGSASTYIKFARAVDPIRSYGFDGTPLRNYEDDNQYRYWEDMQTVGYCGPILVKIGYPELQRGGFLPLTYVHFMHMPKPPKVMMKDVPRHINVTTNYNTIYKHLVVENDYRTSRFARLITNLAGSGKVIALIKQHAHARRLMSMLNDEGVESMAWFGSGKALAVSPARGVYDAPFSTDEVRRRFMETDLPVVVGSSVLSEAISLDVATDAVNLAAGKTFSLSGQRVGRIMRRDNGRTPLVTFWDAHDLAHRVLTIQSNARREHCEAVGLTVVDLPRSGVLHDLRGYGIRTGGVPWDW